MKKIYIIAALAALISGALLYFYLSDLDKDTTPVKQAVTTGQVVTPVQEIPAFTPLTAELLTYTEIPEDYIPADALRSIDQALGLVSDGTLYPGEWLLSSMVGTEQEKAISLSYEIPEGMRAMTVEVDTATGVAGYITAGDHIDLLLYVSPQEAQNEWEEDTSAYTYIAGDNLLVLAVGDLTYVGEDVYTTLTLALTPDQCREVYAAQSMCQYDGSGCGLNALLRRHGDESSLPHTAVETGIE